MGRWAPAAAPANTLKPPFRKLGISLALMKAGAGMDCLSLHFVFFPSVPFSIHLSNLTLTPFSPAAVAAAVVIPSVTASNGS